jgi:hypothetical protein
VLAVGFWGIFKRDVEGGYLQDSTQPAKWSDVVIIARDPEKSTALLSGGGCGK